MINKILEKTYVFGILALILVVYIREFLPVELLIELEVILIILVLLSCIILARGVALYFSVASLVIGHILFFQYNLNFEIWFDGITKNLSLAILFVLVPILSIPLKLGGYLESFYFYVGKYSNKVSSLFTVLTGLLFSLSSITNLGSLRILHSLIGELRFPPKFLAKVFIVGFASSIAWSPYFGSVNLAIYYTGVSFNEYVLWGLFYGISLFIIGNLMFLKDKGLQTQVSAEIMESKPYKEDTSKLKQLVMVLLGLFLTVIIGERLLTFSSMMLLVSLIALIYGFFWAILIKKTKEFLTVLKGYSTTILQVKNEVVFFISVGFFGVIAANTPLQGLIETLFLSIAGYYTFIIVAIIIAATMILSVLGIHMVVTITILGLSLDPAIIGLHPIAFTLTLMGAWVSSMIICPFAPFNVITAGLVNSNPFNICFRWNRSYGVFVAIYSGAYITIVNMILQ